ncbi:MAG: hypothetical protein GY856_38215 [bacterium]|nr:hypothetical protein [bacterium]
MLGEIDVSGDIHAGGNPFELRLWSAGSSVKLNSESVVHGHLYAPDAAVKPAGSQGLRVDVEGLLRQLTEIGREDATLAGQAVVDRRGDRRKRFGGDGTVGPPPTPGTGIGVPGYSLLLQ